MYDLETQTSQSDYVTKLENSHYIVPKLCLLLGVMRKCEMNQLKFYQVNGNCAALLIDQKIWGSYPPPSSTKDKLLTVNFHLEQSCNYKCKFCYVLEGFDRGDKEQQLGKDQGLQLIKKLHEFGIYKINFAGGEPLLNQHLSDYIRYSSSLGLKVSIITNAARMTQSWILQNCLYIDQVGISCDSLDDNVQKKIGRGFGDHVAITKRALKRIRNFNEQFDRNVRIKLNTVVMRQNYQEDWSDFILENGV